jgi:hypothetical protein
LNLSKVAQGPCVTSAIADWCRFNGASTAFIKPGLPWQNAWIE